MTIPVNNNEALIPRRRIRTDELIDETDECTENKPFVTYAPPGANFRARVRHLGDKDLIEKISGVLPDGSMMPVVRNTVTPRQDGETGMVIKIEAEVKLQGDFPAEGIIIETITQVRPGDKEDTK